MRLFVAIDVNAAVRKLAAHARLALEQAGAGGRFEADEKLHLTLAFLGSVDGARLAGVESAVRASAQRAPFSLEFDRLGTFPNGRRPQVIWLGCTRVPQAFVAFGAAVRSDLGRLGFEFDHGLDPHVTICRPKGARNLVLPVLQDSALLRVDHLTLYQSLPAGQTTRYEAIDRTAFADAN